MRIQYKPDIPRTTFESVDPLHTQWDYLEDIGSSATDNFGPTPPEPSSATTATAIGSIPLDVRKREYILYSRRLVRRHISITYTRLGREPPGAEEFSGPQLVSALVRAAKDLDMVAKARKMKSQTAVSLWHAVQYALRGEFITLEQATIRGCGPDAIYTTPSVASSHSDAYPSPSPSVKDKGKKKVGSKKIRKEDVLNLNTFGAKFLRLGSVESAIKKYFEILCEPQNKGNTSSTITTPITPKLTALSSAAHVSAALTRSLPTSCRKPDTGTLPRALHSPGNEFILPIPFLPLPNFTPTKSPVGPGRKKPRKREPSDPEANRIFKREMCSPLLRTRHMHSWGRDWDKELSLGQASRKLPPEPMLEFKSHSELSATGISGVLRTLRVYHDRANDWSQRYLEEQREDLAGTLETRAAILGQRVRRAPLPGSSFLPSARCREPELPKEPVGGITPSGLRQIIFPDQPPSTYSDKYKIKPELLTQLPKRGVEAGIAYLESLMTRFSKSRQVSFAGQPSTPTPAKHKLEREQLLQLSQETENSKLMPTQTPPPSSKGRLSLMAHVEDLDNQGSLIRQKRLKARLERSGGGKVDELREKLNSDALGKQRRSLKSQRKRVEGLVPAAEGSTPTATQISPSSSVLKLSPITNANNMMDPESPLVQRKWRVEQKKSASGKIDEPLQERNSGPDGKAKSLGGDETPSQPGAGNDEGKRLLASGRDIVEHQIPTRVHLKRKRANVEDLSKYGEDFLRPAKRVKMTGPLRPLSIPPPTAQCVIF